MKKATKIVYNPYDNTVQIKIASDSEEPVWHDLADNSELLQYTNPEMKVLFSNIAADVVEVINEKQNSSEDGLEIMFYGPVSDYRILSELVNEANIKRPDKGELTCRHIASYYSADESVQIVKEAYRRISSEFVEYLPGNEKFDSDDDSIGNRIVVFNEIISNNFLSI